MHWNWENCVVEEHFLHQSWGKKPDLTNCGVHPFTSVQPEFVIGEVSKQDSV